MTGGREILACDEASPASNHGLAVVFCRRKRPGRNNKKVPRIEEREKGKVGAALQQVKKFPSGVRKKGGTQSTGEGTAGGNYWKGSHAGTHAQSTRGKGRG